MRDGQPQAIGTGPAEMVVLISLEDLMALLREASQPESFAAALAELGFEPVGHQIAISPERRAPRPTLFGLTPHETA